MFFSMQDREENKMNLINITDRKGGILLSTKKRRHFPVCAIKRISSCSPCPKLHRGQRASMTVEACLVLPLFLFAFLLKKQKAPPESSLPCIHIPSYHRLHTAVSALLHPVYASLPVHWIYRLHLDHKSLIPAKNFRRLSFG